MCKRAESCVSNQPNAENVSGPQVREKSECGEGVGGLSVVMVVCGLECNADYDGRLYA